MKVTLLGTSAAEGWPGLFCRCMACCDARRLGGKNIRTRTSALIDDILKIDFPPDTLHQVIYSNIDLRCLQALLFTHAHDDHCAPAELQYRGIYFVPTPISDALPIYGSADVIRLLENKTELKDVPLTFHTLTPGVAAKVSKYQVTPIPAQHDPSQVCLNFVIQDMEGTSLFYASDTGWYPDTTWEMLQKFKLDGIVVECTKGMQEDGYMGHLSIPDVIRMREKLIACGSFQPQNPMVTTHFSHLSGILHAELEELLHPHNIQAGYDGMVFRVPSSSTGQNSTSASQVSPR